MSELAKAFDPKSIEELLYHFWEASGFFTANPASSKPAFCLIIPPPNVTGSLHMGHALVNTLQDVLTRWKRMDGYEALWIPGTDHAGIATQTVVERHLMKEQGKRRTDYSREEFLAIVWKWKEESEKNILNQLKRVGCSCDWSRLAFTMDAQRSKAVRAVFKKMYDEGFIYQGDYLVNWDPVTQTALADDEVEYEEKEGFLWHIKYPLANGKGYIVVATTRPETMLGDTAVAVSPEDERYTHFVGQELLLPLTRRKIPIVADRFVDSTFGTGAVKITPAHDINDYEMAKRHQLPLLNILTKEGKINAEGGIFAGLSVQEARAAVLKELHAQKLIIAQIPHRYRVGVSYRSKAVIEPYLSKQWFVRLSHFKEKLLCAVKEGKVDLIPQAWEHTYFHWIENLRDWCISRQLWWGHQIPIWYHREDPKKVLCWGEEGVPPEVAAHPEAWKQDEDVLDTWFSSALWPFSTLGWPDPTKELERFYPNSTLITGHDILFFWVARMLCMGEYTLGKFPFPEVFLHGLIYGKSYWRFNKEGALLYITGNERKQYDLGHSMPAGVHAKWEKMSKSKGNIIDPLEIIDTYGADAMRMALCASATHTRQIDLDLRRFEEFKHFSNKIWNGARFVLMNLEDLSLESLQNGLDKDLLQLEDKWILTVLAHTTEKVTDHLTHYHFDKAAHLSYEFFWKQFCAYYVEISKPVLFGKSGSPQDKENKQKLLLILLVRALRLLHPMAPFITEELFQKIKERIPEGKSEEKYMQETLVALSSPACMVAPFPKVCPEEIDPTIEKEFSQLDEIVHAVREIRTEMQIPPNTPTDLFLSAPKKDPYFVLAKENTPFIHALVRLGKIHFLEARPELTFSATKQIGALTLTIPLPEELRQKELIRLSKEKEKLISQQNGVRERLGNAAFLEKAPKEVVESLKSQLYKLESALQEVMRKLS